MGTRRMFTKKITDDDRFVTLPSSAQALYLHLSMSADDDGFSNQVSSSMFKAHASTADLEMLLERKYLYQFDDGVIVIKHWRMANALRKDRYTTTAFQEDLAKLRLDENGAYTMTDDNGCHMVAKCLPQVKLSKDNKEKIPTVSKRKSELPLRKRIPPTVGMVREYVAEQNFSIDPEEFCDFYTSKDWFVGKDKMKDWQAAVRTWERKRKNGRTSGNNQEVRERSPRVTDEARRGAEEWEERQRRLFAGG